MSEGGGGSYERGTPVGDQGVAAGAVTEEAEARAENARRHARRPQVPRRLAGPFSSLILSSLELTDTKVYEP